jgi:hypothetical protein
MPVESNVSEADNFGKKHLSYRSSKKRKSSKIKAALLFTE